jgi:hypothetical protein
MWDSAAGLSMSADRLQAIVDFLKAKNATHKGQMNDG